MIYLDNCSTTRPREEVIDALTKALKEEYGNPSSLHRVGISAEKKIKEARETIAGYLKADSREIYFTSGGTESNNIAIQSIIGKMERRGRHIITTKIEHPSVLNIMKYYENKGFRITYLNVSEYGHIDMKELQGSLCDDTILVALIHVNNEIGSIQDIRSVRDIISNSKSKPLLHLDGVQSFGKIDFSLESLGVDSYSFSGHKIHGPKGIGGLYVNKRLKLSPIVFGGNQESGLRSGTENVPGIIGFGEAVRTLITNGKSEAEKVHKIKEYMVQRVSGEIDDIRINTTLDHTSSPYILSISFRDTRGEVLLHYLEDKDIYVSTSSACSSRGTEKSHVLQAIKCTGNEIEGTIRICFSYEITKDDIDYAVEALKLSVAEIRKIIRR